jgi:hypothetical protein
VGCEDRYHDLLSSFLAANEERWRSSKLQILHYAPSDFLSNLMALANFMRLSLRKAARAIVGERRIAGNPGTEY